MSTTATKTKREETLERLNMAKSFYMNDLKALTEEQLGTSPGGKARSAFEFTHEVAWVNNNVATMMEGTPVTDWPNPENWEGAPKEVCTKDSCMESFCNSVDRIINHVESATDEKFMTPFTVGEEEKSMEEMCRFVTVHMFYHCGQLNYLQAIHGDEKIHWGSDE